MLCDPTNAAHVVWCPPHPPYVAWVPLTPLHPHPTHQCCVTPYHSGLHDIDLWQGNSRNEPVKPYNVFHLFMTVTAMLVFLQAINERNLAICGMWHQLCLKPSTCPNLSKVITRTPVCRQANRKQLNPHNGYKPNKLKKLGFFRTNQSNFMEHKFVAVLHQRQTSREWCTYHQDIMIHCRNVFVPTPFSGQGRTCTDWTLLHEVVDISESTKILTKDIDEM